MKPYTYLVDWSDEGKAKLSKTLTGRIVSEETKSKMRATWAAKRLHKEEK